MGLLQINGVKLIGSSEGRNKREAGRRERESSGIKRKESECCKRAESIVKTSDIERDLEGVMVNRKERERDGERKEKGTLEKTEG